MKSFKYIIPPLFKKHFNHWVAAIGIFSFIDICFRFKIIYWKYLFWMLLVLILINYVADLIISEARLNFKIDKLEDEINKANQNNKGLNQMIDKKNRENKDINKSLDLNAAFLQQLMYMLPPEQKNEFSEKIGLIEEVQDIVNGKIENSENNK